MQRRIPVLPLKKRIELQETDVVACLLPVDIGDRQVSVDSMDSMDTLEELCMKRRPDPAQPTVEYEAWRFLPVHEERKESSTTWTTTVTDIHPQSLTIAWRKLLPPKRHGDNDGDENANDESYSTFRVHNDPIVSGSIDKDTPDLILYSDTDQATRRLAPTGSGDRCTLVSGDLLALANSHKAQDVTYTYFFRQLTHDPRLDFTHGVHQKYDFVRMLGRGGFGSVYLAIHRHKRLPWAIKVQDRPTTQRQQERFKNESAVLPQIEALRRSGVEGSEYLCAYNNIFQEGQFVYSVYEFVNGGDLSQKLRPSNPMSEQQAKRYMRMILLGLSVLHSRQLVHRDLKPSNVLISGADCNADVAKLADFGLTKQLTAGKNLMTYCGTDPYIPPEVQYGDGRDCGGDIYAAGVTLFALLIGNEDCGYTQETLARCCDKCFSAECFTILGELTAQKDRRISIEQALVHPWFTTTSPSATCRASGLGCPHKKFKMPPPIRLMLGSSASSAVATDASRNAAPHLLNGSGVNLHNGLEPIAEESDSESMEEVIVGGSSSTINSPCLQVQAPPVIRVTFRGFDTQRHPSDGQAEPAPNSIVALPSSRRRNSWHELSGDGAESLPDEHRCKRPRSRPDRSIPAGASLASVRASSRAPSNFVKSRRFDKRDTAHRADKASMDEDSGPGAESEAEVESVLRAFSATQSNSHVLYSDLLNQQ